MWHLCQVQLSPLSLILVNHSQPLLFVFLHSYSSLHFLLLLSLDAKQVDQRNRYCTNKAAAHVMHIIFAPSGPNDQERKKRPKDQESAAIREREWDPDNLLRRTYQDKVGQWYRNTPPLYVTKKKPTHMAYNNHSRFLDFRQELNFWLLTKSP